MILSQEAIARIEDYIENVEICDEVEKGNYTEIETNGVILFITFTVFARFVEDYEYHSEVPYNNIEDLSHYEFEGAEITEIEAYNEDDEEVEISNKNDIKYW